MSDSLDTISVEYLSNLNIFDLYSALHNKNIKSVMISELNLNSISEVGISTGKNRKSLLVEINGQTALFTKVDATDGVYFVLNTSDDAVYLDIDINELPNKIEVSDTIYRKAKNKDGIRLPKGTGVALYDLVADYYQQLADSKEKDVVHTLARGLNTGRGARADKPIETTEDWLKKFQPFIVANNYQVLVEDTYWEKTYSSNTKVER